MKTSDVRSTVHFVRAAALPSPTRLSRRGCAKCCSKSLEAQLVQRQRRRQAGNLAITLMTVLHIEPTGRLLVSVCGTGTETDNAEAVLHWISRFMQSNANLGELSFHDVKNAFLRFLISATGQEYVE